MPGYKRRYGFYQDGNVAMPQNAFWAQPVAPVDQGGIPGAAYLPLGVMGGAAALNRFGALNAMDPRGFNFRTLDPRYLMSRPMTTGGTVNIGGGMQLPNTAPTTRNITRMATSGFRPGVGMGRVGAGAALGFGGYFADEALTAMGLDTAGDYAQWAASGAGIGMMLGPTGALVGAAGAMGLKAVIDLFGKDKEPDESGLFMYKASPDTGLGQAQKLVANAPIPEEYANWMTPEQKQMVLTQAAQILGDDIAAGTKVGPGKNEVNNKKASLVVNGLITQYLEGKSAIDAQNAVYGAAGIKRGSSMLELAKATGNESAVLAQMKKSVFEQTTGTVSVGAGVDDDGSAYQIGMAPNGEYIKYIETGEGEYDPTESLMTEKQKAEFQAELSRELTGMDNETKLAINENSVNAQLLGIASTARTADKALIQRSKEHIQNLGFDYNKLMQADNHFNRAQDEVEAQNIFNNAQRVFEFDADFGLRSDRFDFEKDVWGEEFAEGKFRDRRDYSEGVRRFDTEMAENRTQFDINDRRRLQQMQEEARRADASIAQELNQARQQTSDRMREILANPADYLARSYAQRGEVSPFGEVTQADLYNQAMGEYNQYAQYLDALGRGFKADLAAEAQAIRNMRQRRELEAEEANLAGIAPDPPAGPIANVSGLTVANLPTDKDGPPTPPTYVEPGTVQTIGGFGPGGGDENPAGGGATRFMPGDDETPPEGGGATSIVYPTRYFPGDDESPAEGGLPTRIDTSIIPPGDEEFLPGTGVMPGTWIEPGSGVPEDFVPPQTTIQRGGILQDLNRSYNDSFLGGGRTDISPANPNVQRLEPVTWGPLVPVGSGSGGSPPVSYPTTEQVFSGELFSNEGQTGQPQWDWTFRLPEGPAPTNPISFGSEANKNFPNTGAYGPTPSLSLNNSATNLFQDMPSGTGSLPPPTPMNLSASNQQAVTSQIQNALASGQITGAQANAALQAGGLYEHGGVAHGFGNPIVVGDSSSNKENQELVMSFGNAPMVVLPLNERQQEIMEDAGEVGPPRAQIGGMFGGNANFSTLAEMPSRTAFGGTQFGFGMDRPVTQREIRARSERFSSPAVRDIFAGEMPQSLRFGFNLFTPGQLQSLTGGEREELRTRLAARNRTLEDVEQQVMRQFGATGTRRGRRVF